MTIALFIDQISAISVCRCILLVQIIHGAAGEEEQPQRDARFDQPRRDGYGARIDRVEAVQLRDEQDAAVGEDDSEHEHDGGVEDGESLLDAALEEGLQGVDGNVFAVEQDGAGNEQRRPDGAPDRDVVEQIDGIAEEESQDDLEEIDENADEKNSAPKDDPPLDASVDQ